MWLQRISQWQEEQSICEHILSPDQAEVLHKFQVTPSTHHLEASPWCAVDDPFTATRYLYNKESWLYSPGLPDLPWEIILKSPIHNLLYQLKKISSLRFFSMLLSWKEHRKCLLRIHWTSCVSPSPPYCYLPKSACISSTFEHASGVHAFPIICCTPATRRRYISKSLLLQCRGFIVEFWCRWSFVVILHRSLEKARYWFWSHWSLGTLLIPSQQMFILFLLNGHKNQGPFETY